MKMLLMFLFVVAVPAFADQVIEQAKTGKSDMICILNFANEKLIHAFGSDAEQKVITNSAAIPVMVLNPAIFKSISFRFLGDITACL